MTQTFNALRVINTQIKRLHNHPKAWSNVYSETQVCEVDLPGDAFVT